MPDFALTARQICKSFNGFPIVQDFDYAFVSGSSYSISGPNGSGKSTLVRLLAAWLKPDQGELAAEKQGSKIELENLCQHLTWAAPYTELPEELALADFLDIHQQFDGLKVKQKNLLQELELDKSKDKALRDLSTGMQQRLKLALCFYSSRPLLLLDEPASNLDARWTAWMHEKGQEQQNKLMIVAGNTPEELQMGEHKITLKTPKTA